jgi:hypothetical protein
MSLTEIKYCWLPRHITYRKKFCWLSRHITYRKKNFVCYHDISLTQTKCCWLPRHITYTNTVQPRYSGQYNDGTTGWTIPVSNHRQSKYLISSSIIRSRLWSPLYWEELSLGYCDRGVMLATHLRLVPKLGMSGCLPSLPFGFTRRVHRHTFFTLYLNNRGRNLRHCKQNHI